MYMVAVWTFVLLGEEMLFRAIGYVEFVVDEAVRRGCVDLLGSTLVIPGLRDALAKVAAGDGGPRGPAGLGGPRAAREG